MAIQADGEPDENKAIWIKAETKEELTSWHGDILNEAHGGDGDEIPDKDWWSILFDDVSALAFFCITRTIITFIQQRPILVSQAEMIEPSASVSRRGATTDKMGIVPKRGGN